VALAALIAVLGLAACGRAAKKPTTVGHPAETLPPLTVSTTTTVAPTTSTSTTTVAPSTTSTSAAVGPFTSSVTTVTAADVPYTWRPGCPVPPSQLRRLSLSYWGFDGRAHPGTMIVNEAVAAAVVSVFRTLYDERFPIYEMVPEDVYHGDDNAAAAADDTSGFNCRQAVVPPGQPSSWSAHAYGEAIDVNDVQNPYVDGSTVIPPAGAAYENRSTYRPGMAIAGGQLVRAFASVGWQWGGRWTQTPDYQHFSATGG
jgi:hypothetical protein